MRRPTGAAGAQLARQQSHQEGLPKVWAEICSQPNQSAISGSFFGTKYWKCAESDDGNPKKSMILHRMVPSDSAESVLIDLPAPPRPKQRVLAPLQDAGGAAGGRRPRPEGATAPGRLRATAPCVCVCSYTETDTLLRVFSVGTQA